MRQLHLGGERGQMRAERWPYLSWIRCRCSISRSRWRERSPSSARDLAGRLRIDLPALRRAARLAAARLCAVAAEPRRILNVHCYLRVARIEPFQLLRQSRAFHRR